MARACGLGHGYLRAHMLGTHFGCAAAPGADRGTRGSELLLKAAPPKTEAGCSGIRHPGLHSRLFKAR